MSDVNSQLAAIFQRMADVTEILGGDRFRINAFARTARIIDDLGEDLADIGPDEKQLAEIDGVGKGTAQRIAEYLETGKVQDHDQLMGKIPNGLLELLDVPGLGPKTVALLWKDGGVDSLDSLKNKLKDDSLADLPGLGKKKLENLRKNISFAESAGQRVRIGQALPLATWVIAELRKVKGVQTINYAGSLRRGRETIGDLDILVAADEVDRKRIADAFTSLSPVSEIIAKGKTKCSVRLSPGGKGASMQADLRLIDQSQYGAALLYFTGSKEHNVQLRERAVKRGLTLNEYGLARKDDDKSIVAAATEEEVYKALDLAWIPPELREARGEIKLAEQGQLPTLISRDDIRCELHAHTDASDGRWSIRELAGAAADRGFHTVAVTDHSKGQVQANGLSNKRLEEHIERVREVASEMKGTITILAGSEVDILADGSLDYPNSLLKELDIVVASPHGGLSQDGKKATARLRKAIDSRYVSIIGHPTGRLINRREGLSPDIRELAQAAAKRGVALEINANHWRLDLRDVHVRIALEAGAKLSINTDAHGPADLDQLTYGVLTARRGGAGPEHVVNCLNAKDLRNWLKSTRDV